MEKLELLSSTMCASGYQGVERTPAGRFKARVRVDGKQHYLGLYHTAAEAALARARWRREHDAAPVTLESAVERLHLGVFEAVDEETRARLVACLSQPTFDGLMAAVDARKSTEAKLALVTDRLTLTRGSEARRPGSAQHPPRARTRISLRNPRPRSGCRRRRRRCCTSSPSAALPRRAARRRTSSRRTGIRCTSSAQRAPPRCAPSLSPSRRSSGCSQTATRRAASRRRSFAPWPPRPSRRAGCAPLEATTTRSA